jgi:RNA polymerase sigma factor (TIGR02999 family)
MGSSADDVTALLLAWGQGEQEAFDRLLPLVHGELRRLAHRQMAGERTDHTLQTTALINEAYLRLVDLDRVRWQDRSHFLAMSARVMRRILVDHARSRQYLKRRGGAATVEFDDAVMVCAEPEQNIVALDDALEALAAFDARKSRVIEMRFFGGLTVDETASALGVSPETVRRDWRLAKAWLLRELRTHR